MKKILTLLCGIVLLASCSHDEVISTWPDGSTQTLQQIRGKGDHRRVCSEKRFYMDGALQYEKFFKGKENTPCGTWKYYYFDGTPFAEGQFDEQHQQGYNWSFMSHEGGDYFVAGYDSLNVVELSELGTPATVMVYRKDTVTFVQFFSNATVHALGKSVMGRREGHWYFYHPNGNLQVESNFCMGKEEGVTTVYRENGIPYYRGTYEHGKPVGTWEFYDPEGNLADTKTY